MDIINYIPDIVAIIFVLLFVVFGIKKGFIHTLIHSASFFIAIVATFCFANPVIKWLSESTLGIAFKEMVYNFILTPVQKAPEMLLKDLSLPEFLIKGISESQPVLNIAENLSQNISGIIISILVYLLIFIITKIALKIVDKSMGLVAKLPIIKQLNSLLGGVMGFVSGVLWIYVILSVIATFTFIPSINSLTEYITNSEILAFLYKNNLILGLFL